ncbi:cellulase family glycosylhydrolase [Glycomyces sp. L485]|uniref:cellulase family glycosylhydrolase n=1 Tax=Glycomyces sp. L485 TaxID=2909235 RepID=UPI001F4AE881|nr:cellulase family glycosylhydrolase [Glycomyces sp. L485]MCH7230838.1 cellulase family glycosylhydrolase [Glycomyces sp. L485]
MRRSRRRLLLILAPAVAVLAGLGIIAPMAAQAAEGCEVDYQVQNEWPGGFSANVNITNLGDPIDGWELAWIFPSDQQVTQAWSADVDTSGSQTTATNVGYNAQIASNGSTSFGFNGSWSGTNTDPTAFTLNGVECTGDIGQPTTAPPTTTPPPTGDVDAVETVAAMEPGWNLGNSLDAVGDDETAWGNPRITQQLIQNVKDQGYNSIRIPVTWDDHQGGAPDYTIDPAYLDRVEEVVNWALDADLYVLINIHHDSWIWAADMQSNRTEVLDRYETIWTAMADRFRDSSSKLLFESINEPQFNNVDDATAYDLLDELNIVFHQIVRDSGGNNADRVLVLPTLHTNAEQERLDALTETIDALNDPNIAATVHYYGFWPFSVNVAGYTTFDEESRQDIVDNFDRVHNEFTANGVPVIIGEWGLLGFDAHTGTIEQGEKLKFFEFVGYYAQQKDLTLQVWDNGQHFDRTSFQWSDPELFAMMEASWTSRSGTASTDQVFVEKAALITDETVTLNLNGGTFQRLLQGGTELEQGSDYTVSGDQLTITASALTGLVGSQEYGNNADLYVEFSQGAPWRISIVSYDTPILQSVSGSTDSFAIPTQFRGDQLATMEATYVSGGNAGPHDWTSYKEFARAFQPDYDVGEIELTSDFFDAVDDGQEVTLTFHFWSGETVAYTVTKSGSSVTGSAG